MEKKLTYRAEYLWIDGTEPTAEIRSKTKILADGDEPGILNLGTWVQIRTWEPGKKRTWEHCKGSLAWNILKPG